MNAREKSPANCTSNLARRSRKQSVGPDRECKTRHQTERAPWAALTFWRDSFWRLLALLIVVYSGWKHSSVHVPEQVQIALVIGASPDLAKLLKRVSFPVARQKGLDVKRRWITIKRKTRLAD